MSIIRTKKEIDEIVDFINKNKNLTIQECRREIRKKFNDFSNEEMEEILKSRIIIKGKKIENQEDFER